MAAHGPGAAREYPFAETRGLDTRRMLAIGAGCLAWLNTSMTDATTFKADAGRPRPSN